MQREASSRSRDVRPVSFRGALGALVILGASSFSARSALALQPVTEFLSHAKSWNPQNRAAHATATQRDAEVSISTGSLLPNLSATGTYTRNQYEVTTAALSGGITIPGVPPTVIQHLNQLDANVTLVVPIINVANWDRRDAAQSTLAGARAEEENSNLAVEKDVIRDYYTLLGSEAVLQSAASNLKVTQNNVKMTRDRKANGTSSELDVQRALADQARAEQSLTAAQLGVTNTRRDLYSLSGLEAEPATDFPEDDLHPELPLEAWMGKTSEVPSVQSAVANRVTTEKTASAIKAELLPTVSGVAQEKFTNATAFIGGHTSVYLLQLTASFKLDATLGPELRAQGAAVAVARANEDRARRAAEDAVFRDWQQVRADIDSVRAARVQVAAAKLAASLAQDRYASGVATQLDVLQARQDAFSADVSRIQEDADLAYARFALRLDAGVRVKERQ